MIRIIKIAILILLAQYTHAQSVKFTWSEPMKFNGVLHPYVLSNASRFLVLRQTPLEHISLTILDKKSLKIIKFFNKKGEKFEKQDDYGFDQIILSQEYIYIFVSDFKRGDVVKYVHIYDLNGVFLKEKLLGRYVHGTEYIEARNNFNIFHLSIKHFNSSFTKLKKEDEIYYDKDFNTIASRVNENFDYYEDKIMDTAYGENSKRYELVKRYKKTRDLYKGENFTFILKTIDESSTKPTIETILPLRYQKLGLIIRFQMKGNHLIFKSFYEADGSNATPFDGIFCLKYDVTTQSIVQFKEKAIDKAYFFQHLYAYNNKSKALIRPINIVELEKNEEMLVFQHTSNHGTYNMGTEYGNVLAFKLVNDVELISPLHIAMNQEFKPQMNTLDNKSVLNGHDMASSVYNFFWDEKMYFIYNEKEQNTATNTSSEIEELDLKAPNTFGPTVAFFDRNKITKKFLFNSKDENKIFCTTLLDNYKVKLEDKLFYAYSFDSNEYYFGIIKIEK